MATKKVDEKVDENAQPKNAEVSKIKDFSFKRDVIDIFNIRGMINTRKNAAPTKAPTRFDQQFQIYNGSLYVYDRNNKTWLTVGANYACGNAGDPTGGATGNQVFTGLGFKPKMIKAMCTTGVNNGGMSWGVFTENDGHHEQIQYFDGSNWVRLGSAAYIISAINSGGTQLSRASVGSLDSDGFTLNWAFNQTIAFFNWEAFG